MTRVEIETPSGTAWADIDRPDAAPQGVLYLGHGAGGGVEAPDIRAAKDGALAANFIVARITQPYRVAGRRTPVPAPRLDEAWLTVTSTLTEQLGNPLTVHCGRSSGARVACRTAAVTGAVAVIALAFPLHLPGRPERSRLDELELPTVPVLVIQGDRDTFGMPPPAPKRRIVVIPGDTHSLKKDLGTVSATVSEFLTEQLAPKPRRAKKAPRAT
jgi:predicted alpha/beta-hydrolase family hydrolase